MISIWNIVKNFISSFFSKSISITNQNAKKNSGTIVQIGGDFKSGREEDNTKSNQ